MSLRGKIDYDLCRMETLARVQAFVAALNAADPKFTFYVMRPLERQIACTVYASVRHTEDRKYSKRAVNVENGGAVVANLTDAEKNGIAVAVQDAAVGCGMQVWYKHSESTPSRLVYRVGYGGKGE